MMPEEQNRQQFHDVSRPGRVGPTPTSRPVIVGHRPTMPDPMLNERPMHHQPQAHAPLPSRPPGPTIPIDGISPPPSHHAVQHQASHATPAHDNHFMPQPERLESPPLVLNHHHHTTPEHHHLPQASEPEAVAVHKHRSKLWALLVVVLVIVIGLYLLIDSGVIHTSVQMPFHLFHQETPPVYTPPS